MSEVRLSRVLIANRGEIALRIIRACHEEGLEAVAVYSDADRLSPHVRAANAAVALGAPPAAESYLDIAKLIAAAKATGCEAIHPGYGFLSERETFARAVQNAGLIFVGPPPAAIKAMGDKTEARRRMQAAGIPVVPGTAAPVRDAAEARREAQRLGLPVLLKPASGGGGRGLPGRRHHRIPARADRRVLLPRDEYPHPGRAPRHRARVRSGPGAGAAADRRGGADADPRWGELGAPRARHRMSHHRRGPRQRIPPGVGEGGVPAGPRGSGHPLGWGGRGRERRDAVLRSTAGEAAGLGRNA